MPDPTPTPSLFRRSVRSITSAPTRVARTAVGAPLRVIQDLGHLRNFGTFRHQPQAIIIHHTNGVSVNGDINTLRQRGLGSQYIIDRDGTVHQLLPSGERGAHILPSWGAHRGLSNANTIGIEVTARNAADVTPAQHEATQNLSRYLAQQNGIPLTNIYGHGEVNPGHKEPDEGLSDARALRGQSLPQIEQQAFHPENTPPPPDLNIIGRPNVPSPTSTPDYQGGELPSAEGTGISAEPTAIPSTEDTGREVPAPFATPTPTGSEISPGEVYGAPDIFGVPSGMAGSPAYEAPISTAEGGYTDVGNVPTEYQWSQGLLGEAPAITLELPQYAQGETTPSIFEESGAIGAASNPEIFNANLTDPSGEFSPVPFFDPQVVTPGESVDWTSGAGYIPSESAPGGMTEEYSGMYGDISGGLPDLTAPPAEGGMGPLFDQGTGEGGLVAESPGIDAVNPNLFYGYGETSGSGPPDVAPDINWENVDLLAGGIDTGVEPGVEPGNVAEGGNISENVPPNIDFVPPDQLPDISGGDFSSDTQVHSFALPGTPGVFGSPGAEQLPFREMLSPMSPEAFSKLYGESGWGQLFSGMRDTVWNPNLGQAGGFQNVPGPGFNWTQENQQQWDQYQANPNGYVQNLVAMNQPNPDEFPGGQQPGVGAIHYGGQFGTQ